MEFPDIIVARRAPWNKGKLVGQKPPLAVAVCVSCKPTSKAVQCVLAPRGHL